MATERYNGVNSYLKRRFGTKVYKLALTASVTCPNRDGTVGTRGCIFCSVKGSGEFAASGESVREQIDRGIELLGKKGEGCKYIAYFQSFTNTYGDINYLRSRFEAAADDERIVLLSVATRPDCLGDEVLDMLAHLAKRKPVWVELGLQSIHKSTARYIRRGYELDVYERAVRRLHSVGIEVITHQIIGLPGEDAASAVETARYIGRHSDGIKLQLLHILKDSDLYGEYLEGRVPVLSLEEYTDILGRCIKALPKKTVIHRITGDGDKKTLASPLWSADKKRVLNYINQAFERDDVIQGIDSEPSDMVK